MSHDDRRSGAPPPGQTTLPGQGAPSPYAQQPHYPQQPVANPYAPPAHPYPPPPAPGFFPPPPPPGPAPWAAPAPRKTHLIAAVAPPSGHGFGAMAMLSMKRAFRLRIDANEVLEDERHKMLAARPPIVDETQQAFLAWRRSVLFMAALLMVPVAALHALDELDFPDGTPEIWKTLTMVSVAVEVGFAILLWTQVPRWTSWRKQSRVLSWGWLLYFLTPFLVFLYPLASAIDMSPLADTGGEEAVHAAKLTVGIVIGASALVSLAPKIISLLQGLIRASIATKTLFPGSSAPGWLMVLAAPLYMVIFYVFVLLPYQYTGSELVVVGVLLVLAAKGTLVKAGLRLTRPMTDEAARNATKRVLALWMTLLLGGVGCIIGGLWDLVQRASALSVASFALSMGANILLLTLITTDAVITGLDRARGVTDDERRLADEVPAEVAAFTAAGSQDAAA